MALLNTRGFIALTTCACSNVMPPKRESMRQDAYRKTIIVSRYAKQDDKIVTSYNEHLISIRVLGMNLHPESYILVDWDGFACESVLCLFLTFPSGSDGFWRYARRAQRWR